MFSIEEELKKAPEKPGVYIMRDVNDGILYVGKAIKLKNRLRQYFQSSRNLMPKIAKMVSLIDHFEYIITDSEVEALVLESNLIKEHQPKYNTMLKDDKNYPYVKITIHEAFPRVIFARQLKKDKSKYFGPFTSSIAVKDTIELLRKIYKIRTCNRSLPKDTGKARPCLNYHMKQCDAPCQGYISEEEYKKQISQIVDFLNGNDTGIRKMLETKMYEASEKMEYEDAAYYRDLLEKIKSVSIKQKINQNSELEDKDIIAFARADDEAVVQVFFIRNGKLIGREHYHLTGVRDDKKSEVITAFIKQFYAGTPFIPKELLLQEDIEDKEVITQWLSAKRGQKVYIKVPIKGEKEKLVELAAKNAALVLCQDSEKIKREEARTKGAVTHIQQLLGIGAIKRIESFDISNISGFESVGSMVVYEEGRPKRNDYRKFKIKWVKGANDYASMEEVLTRRFVHGMKELEEFKEKDIALAYGSFTKYPDLILMDGGKGQVNIALKVLNELNINIPVCGMVKDDNHRTRGLYYMDKEIPMDKSSEAFKLITRIQDETHRFAITYHRTLRNKTQVKSILDDIQGVGEARRKALMKHFLSIEDIKAASIEDLSKVPAMNEQVAKKVYEFFH